MVVAAARRSTPRHFRRSRRVQEPNAMVFPPCVSEWARSAQMKIQRSSRRRMQQHHHHQPETRAAARWILSLLLETLVVQTAASPSAQRSPSMAAAAPAAVCDTHNASVAAIAVVGAGSPAVNGRYVRAEDTSDGLPVFVLDTGHQLYSHDHAWRLAYRGSYTYYLSEGHNLRGPPLPSPGEWSAGTHGKGAGPSSITCEFHLPPPSPPPSPPPNPPPPAPVPPVRKHCSNSKNFKTCPDMPCTCDVPADLVAPPVRFNTTAAPEQLVAQTTPGFGYDPSRVFHLIYLPPDWVNGSTKYPIIFEYSGNTQLPQDVGAHTHGWGIGQGQTFIWVVLPFISGRVRNISAAAACNQRCYHGCAPDGCNRQPYFQNERHHDCSGTNPHFDPEPTLEYTIATVHWIVDEYNGDAGKTILTGHSRGSLATMYFGLYDDRIAELWAAFVPIALFDGADVDAYHSKAGWQRFPPYPNASTAEATVRLQRLRGRPVFHAGECISATNTTMTYLLKTGIDLSNFTVRGLGFVDHTSLWALRPSPIGTRAELRSWVGRVLDVKMPIEGTQRQATAVAAPAAVCDTHNASVAAIAVVGAGSPAVNGRYVRAKDTSDGLPVFVLDTGHQLYSHDHAWRLAYRGSYTYYLSEGHNLRGPPLPSPGEWSAGTHGKGTGPSSITCEFHLPPPSPPPSPPPNPPPPGSTVLEFAPGSQWHSFGYPAVCTRHKKAVGPDSMPIAWYDRNRSITRLLTANHRHMNAGIGSSLDNLTRCNDGPVFHSYGNSTPQSYANNQWLQSVRVFANGTVAGLVHNEFHGDMEGEPYCSHRYKRGQPICGIWSTGLAVAVDGGGHFRLAAHPPQHLVAALPYKFLKDEPTAGYGVVSSVLRGSDHAFYGAIDVLLETARPCNTTEQPLCGETKPGSCLWRATDIFDPASFRARDEAGKFSIQWKNPYGSSGGGGICATIPITNDSAFGKHITFRRIMFSETAAAHPTNLSSGRRDGMNRTLPTFIAVSDANISHYGSGGGFHSSYSVKYSLSFVPDFGAAMHEGSWTAPQFLHLDPPAGISSAYKYPTVLDSQSPQLGHARGTTEAQEDGDSFALISGDSASTSLYLYVQFEKGGNMRRQVQLRQY